MWGEGKRDRVRLIVLHATLSFLAACSGSGDPSVQEEETVATLVYQTTLPARPSNLTCVATERPEVRDAKIALVKAFPKLPPLGAPIAMYQAPGDDSRWFVIEKAGRVRVFANDPEVDAFEPDMIDLRARVNDFEDSGLLGMAFHPDFQQNGVVFFYWTENWPMVSIVARFKVVPGTYVVDPGSEEVILRANQNSSVHHGGHLGFGEDGYLYIALGDSGWYSPYARWTSNILGAVLRIHVDGAFPYEIPETNPFFGNPVCPADHTSQQSCPEIYAWGFRSPWRWSFDRGTGKLWLGDVGLTSWEEVNVIEKGGNYGWDCREGAHPNPLAGCAEDVPSFDPVYAYPHDDGNFAIIGGYVYRGSAVPSLQGNYVFGDLTSGRIWRLVERANSSELDAEELLDTDLNIVSFAEDSSGELYVVDYFGGIYRIEKEPGQAPDPNASEGSATLLSATGCMLPDDPSRPALGLIPYDVASPLWSDGADKERWLAIPDGTTIAVDGEGNMSLPSGSVLVKHFRLDGRLVETRLLVRHLDGQWAGYSYEWNEEGTDATLVRGGKATRIGDREWSFPSGNECLVCHTRAAGVVLGLKAAQLNHDFLYPFSETVDKPWAGQRYRRIELVGSNQLATLSRIGMFESPVGDVQHMPKLVSPQDPTESLDRRARAYLDANCSQCHRPGGTTPSAMDLRFATELAATNTCDVLPRSGSLGIEDARIIAPGDPDRSVLLERLGRRDAHGMPPLGTNEVHAGALELIEDWIASLPGCM